MSCCFGSDGDRGHCNVDKGWSDCWYTENTLDELPEDGRQKHHGGWTGCVVEGSSGVRGIEGVLGWECKTCSSSQQMSVEVETCSEIFMASQNAAFEHCKNHNAAGLPLEFERLDSGPGPKTQNCELECEDGGERYLCEETTEDGSEPVVETLTQNWSSVDHREEQHECADCHQTTHAQLAGNVARMDHKEICAKALRCRGLEWWRWRQLHWKEVEKDNWSGPHTQRFNIYWWEDMVAEEVSKFTGNAEGLSESVQDNTSWLHLAENRGR